MGYQDHLKTRGLSNGTRTTYGRIAHRIEGPPVKWLLYQVSQYKKGMPEGTLLPMRAAVTHYLIAVQGYSEAEAKALVPKIKARKAAKRTALFPEQLALFLSVADAMVPEPAKTILKLMPTLGLRISEIVSLRGDQFQSKSNRLMAYVHGKGAKTRPVPIPKSAEALLRPFLEKSPEGYLFPGKRKGHITPAAVRHHTRRMREAYPDLGDALCPHQLRHTFATLAIARGMSLVHLQALLGHESIKTTERYLHPSEADLFDAMDAIDRSQS